MSKKQNKKEAQKKARRDELQGMDKHLLETTFALEVQSLPFEELTEHEQELINKCTNKEHFTKTEFNQLKELLGRYRKYIRKYGGAEENNEKALKIIKSEKELLDLLDNPERYKLQMKYRVGQQTVILNLYVKPLTSSQSVSEMKSHMRLFSDLTFDERILVDRATTGGTVSSEEEKMLKHIQAKMLERVTDIDTKVTEINEFLARQVEFEEASLNTFEEKKQFWSRIEVGYKISLYNKVRDILNITEQPDEDLFLTR